MKPTWIDEKEQMGDWVMDTHWLTEVEDHAGEHNESKPHIEVGHEVDDGDDDVTDGGKDAEQDVAKDKNNHKLLSGYLCAVCHGFTLKPVFVML